MKLRFWRFLITFLLPTSAFANICESRLKNKSANYLKTESKAYIAYGTHKPTKKTIWQDCSDYSPFRGDGQKLNCLGKKFTIWPSINSMHRG